jgi:hypothetical protein
MWKNVLFLDLEGKKGDFKYAEGNGKASKKVAWGEEKFSITDAP